MSQPVQRYKDTVAKMWASIFSQPGPAMRQLLDQSFPTRAASETAFRMGFDEAVLGLRCDAAEVHTNGWLMNSHLTGYASGLRERLALRRKPDTSAVALMADGKPPKRVVGYATVAVQKPDGGMVRERLPLYEDGSSATSSADGVLVTIEDVEML